MFNVCVLNEGYAGIDHLMAVNYGPRFYGF